MHQITREQDKTNPCGNLWTTTAVCSCGWRGTPRPEWDDYQLAHVEQDAARHLANPDQK